MLSGYNQAQPTGENNGKSALWSDDNEGIKEPLHVFRCRTSSPLLEKKGSEPRFDDGSEREEDKHKYENHCRRGSAKPMKSEPTDGRGKSPAMVPTYGAKAENADAQGGLPIARALDHASTKTNDVPDSPLGTNYGTASPSGGKEREEPPPSARVSRGTRLYTARPPDFIVSEALLMAPTPEQILKEVRDRKAETKEPELGSLTSFNAKCAKQYPESSTPNQNPNAVDSDPIPEAMASRSVAKPLVGAPLCEGDTTLTQNFLPPAVIDGLFEKLCEEVHFKKMRHQGSEVPRFVAVQGTIDPDGTQPVYRHPSDESPPLADFTPAVQRIRGHVERQLGHPVNHVLIQCYRNGNDYISEHSDKTLDIFRWSYIANVSIGAMRTMVFRTKRGDKKDGGGGIVDKGRASGSSTPLEAIDRAATNPVDILKDVQPVKRQTTRCSMPHNSLLKVGLVTNEKWLHGVKADKRPQSEKSSAELAWNGTRISLTFRCIATFLSPSSSPSAQSSSTSSSSEEPLIWGQGAVSKTRAHARPVLNGQTPEAVAMLRAFGRENNSPEFDWEANYGPGYDVLHMKAAPRYFGCGDGVVDGRVRIMLAECGVKYARGNIGVDARQRRLDRGSSSRRGAEVGEVLPVRFVVDDADRTTVVGDVAILLFMDAKHPRKRGSDAEVAAVYSRFYAAIALEQRWKNLWASAPRSRKVFAMLKPHLTELEKWAAEAASHKGLEPSIADYALWPVLHDVALAWKSVAQGRGAGHTIYGHLGLPALDGYYREFGERSSVVGVFGTSAVASVLPGPGLAADEEDEEEGMEDAEKKPGKGRLPKLTEFGEVAV